MERSRAAGGAPVVAAPAWRGALRSPRRRTAARAVSTRARYFVEILDVGAHRAVDSLHLGICRFYDVVLIGRVRPAAMAQPKVPRGQLQRLTREHIARPGAGVARQQNGLDARATVHRFLRPDDQRVARRARGIEAASHVDFDITVAALGEMRLERGER